MKILHLLSTLSIVVLISCGSDDNSTKCLDSAKLKVTRQDEFSKKFGLKYIFDNEKCRISVPFFISPNGDGVRDSFVIYLENQQDENAFISSSFDLVENISDQATEDPAGFITSATLEISNNCNTIATITDINRLYWNPPFEPPLPEGTYKFHLKLKLADGSLVETRNTFEVLDTKAD